MTCESCGAEPAVACVWDEPDNEGAMLFGDELIGLLVCEDCLHRSQALGPWAGVELLEEIP